MHWRTLSRISGPHPLEENNSGPLLLPHCDYQKYLQMLPNVPTGAKSPFTETHCPVGSPALVRGHFSLAPRCTFNVSVSAPPLMQFPRTGTHSCASQSLAHMSTRNSWLLSASIPLSIGEVCVDDSHVYGVAGKGWTLSVLCLPSGCRGMWTRYPFLFCPVESPRGGHEAQAEPISLPT